MDITTLKIGTIGEILVLDVGIILAGDEITEIQVLRPDLTTTTWRSAPTAGTTNITYTLAEGDLDQRGNYYITPSVDEVLGETARIRAIGLFD